MPYYYTYRITCRHPDSIEKYYYGFRKSNVHPKDDIYWSSSKYVNSAIIKYGIEYFDKKIIKIFNNPEDAIMHESKLHEKFKVDKHNLFFNRSRSTIWGFRTTGLILSGKTYEEIHGIERARELRNIKSLKMAEYRKNNPDSVSGTNNPNYGNKWTEEKKQEFSSRRQKENHPCFGLKWINNGIITKKIPLTDPIPDGWNKGRSLKVKNEVV